MINVIINKTVLQCYQLYLLILSRYKVFIPHILSLQNIYTHNFYHVNLMFESHRFIKYSRPKLKVECLLGLSIIFSEESWILHSKKERYTLWKIRLSSTKYLFARFVICQPKSTLQRDHVVLSCKLEANSICRLAVIDPFNRKVE